MPPQGFVPVLPDLGDALYSPAIDRVRNLIRG